MVGAFGFNSPVIRFTTLRFVLATPGFIFERVAALGNFACFENIVMRGIEASSCLSESRFQQSIKWKFSWHVNFHLSYPYAKAVVP